MGAFCSAKIVCHVAITWNFPLYPFFLVIVVQSVTTEVVTLCTTLMIISPPIRDGSATPEKTKWELVIRDKNFLDLNTGYHCRHSFCFALSRIHKKILASVYERSYESSILPPLKTAFKNIGC